MRKPLVVVLFLLIPLFLSTAPGVKALPNSPTVWPVPHPVQKYSYVDLHIKSSYAPTYMYSPIKVIHGSSEWILQQGGVDVSITLPDVGDEIYIRFGAGGVANVVIVNDPGTAITISPGSSSFSWSAAVPSPLDEGTYTLRFGGMDWTTFTVLQDFQVIPEVPLGVATVLMASMAAFGFRRLRRK